MTKKEIPFTLEEIEKIAKNYPTPFYVYDEEAILANAREFKDAFAWAPDFKNYFAVKANPNPQLVSILAKEGFGADCSSIAELIISDKIGITKENIMFTSNNTPAEEYKKAKQLGAIINLDDITHIEYLEKEVGLPELLSFRYNPGKLREGNAIIGNPEEAKYGLTRDQLFQAYEIAQKKGVKRFGLHTMLASNELNPEYFIETGKMLFELVVEVKKRLNIQIEFVNLGMVIGIPYTLEQKK